MGSLLRTENMKIDFLGNELKRVTAFSSNPKLQCNMINEIIQSLKVEVEDIKLRIIRK
jgi:hypothetical protein